jgi:hypothetical protein
MVKKMINTKARAKAGKLVYSAVGLSVVTAAVAVLGAPLKW